MKIGAQLFSVRDKFTNDEETYNTLITIKEYGYTSVQVSGFPYDAKKFRQYADELDLHIGLTHTALNEIINNTDKVIEDHIALGVDVVGLGFPQGYVNFQTGEVSDFSPLIKALEAPVKKLNDAGLMFGYHNHHIEFMEQNGVRPIDLIYENTNWQFIFDTGWADHIIGKESLEYIKKFAPRLKYAHLKDFRAAKETDKAVSERIVSIYSGETPINEIMQALIDAGVSVTYVEQDTAPNYPDSLLEMKKSIDAIKKKGWI